MNSSTMPDFRKMLADGAKVLDVRTREEYMDGHVPGSVNIPLDMVEARAFEIAEMGTDIIAVCRSGARSGAATEILRRAGIPVVNGGGWQDFMQRIS